VRLAISLPEDKSADNIESNYDRCGNREQEIQA